MKILLISVTCLLFALLLRADKNVDKPSRASDKSEEPRNEEGPKNAYRVISGPPVEEPPLYQEIRVPVIQKIPVIRRLIKVYRPEIKQVFVPVDVEEKVRGAPLMAAPFDDILDDQLPPAKNGRVRGNDADRSTRPSGGLLRKGQFSGPRIDPRIK